LRHRVDDQVVPAQIFFTAALGWSNAIFAHAYGNQTAQNWLDGQHRVFIAFGGVSRIAVPDGADRQGGSLRAEADRGVSRLRAPP